ncbi:hypothetical protein [Janthinobacterium sp.]|uniref:hypothetical protein n=1 Tax=Janthinobacterium sp. TaxID=1871054 RepID=UPI00293D26C8|nr:hypothetical protein [Janthinobacterium sp.]
MLVPSASEMARANGRSDSAGRIEGAARPGIETTPDGFIDNKNENDSHYIVEQGRVTNVFCPTGRNFCAFTFEFVASSGAIDGLLAQLIWRR